MLQVACLLDDIQTGPRNFESLRFSILYFPDLGNLADSDLKPEPEIIHRLQKRNIIQDDPPNQMDPEVNAHNQADIVNKELCKTEPHQHLQQLSHSLGVRIKDDPG